MMIHDDPRFALWFTFRLFIHELRFTPINSSLLSLSFRCSLMLALNVSAPFVVSVADWPKSTNKSRLTVVLTSASGPSAKWRDFVAKSA